MSREETRKFLAELARPVDSPEPLFELSESFINEVALDEPQNCNEVLDELKAGFSLENTRCGLVAALCGVAVEQGGDVQIIVPPLLARVAEALPKAAALATACRDELEAATESETADFRSTEQQWEERTDEPEPFDSDDTEIDPVDQVLTRHAEQGMTEEYYEWQLLLILWPLTIAALSRSENRAELQAFREHAQALQPFHPAGVWLDNMLAVLENEPLLVIEPGSGRGAIGTMSGVADNSQLQTLLMDRFPGGSEETPLSPLALAVAEGKGPQETDEPVVGRWNMYCWRAVRPDLTLPPSDELDSNDDWIWVEGLPEDIPVFEGYRVVLLGPPPYARSWPSQRMFAHLKADVTLNQPLTADECRTWLQKMAGG